jgi:hypothetical protein
VGELQAYDIFHRDPHGTLWIRPYQDSQPTTPVRVVPVEVTDRIDARIDQLEGVVAKLPKTVDGVPITPGMELFSPIYDGPARAELRYPFTEYPIYAVGWGVNVAGAEVYSTAEAARARSASSA